MPRLAWSPCAGTDVALEPRAPPHLEYRVDGDKYVLAYHHYSLVMNSKRRFAWYSAANVDGKRRPTLPERKDDDWYIDPRIDSPDAPRFQC